MKNSFSLETRHFYLFIVSFILIFFSAEAAYSIQVTSVPTSEIAEGQYYFYKIKMDKVLPAGCVEVVEKPDWLKFDAENQVLSGIATASYGENAVRITIKDGSKVLNHNFTVNVRHLYELPKIITDYVNPANYPEYNRRKFPTPTWLTFNNKVQFVGGRVLSDFQWENPDTKFGIAGERPVAPRWLEGYGNVFWPGIRWFGNLQKDPQKDPAFKTAMKRMKEQGIYLFNVGGYGPGSPFKGSFGMFRLPDNYRDALQTNFGEKFLGFDIGEQDGRYLMVMNKTNSNNSPDRFQSYLNFHNYTERLSNDLGNKMTLLTVQWGSHYQAKNNNVYMIGAESQPKSYVTNNSVNYMMLRGAARTYGLTVFGNVSVFGSGINKRGSSKAYGKLDEKSGPTKGNSLNLMRRMMFSQYLYNCAMLGFEGGLFEHPFLSTQNETPITEIQKQMYKFVQSNPRAGVMYAPVAVLQDFWSGWIPKGGFCPLTEGVSTFGTNKWDNGDWQTHFIIDKIFTDYDKNGEDPAEVGGHSDTPFGDMADGLLTDAPKEVLSQYGLIIFSGSVRESDTELKDKVDYYLNQGGNLILTAHAAQKIFPQWFNSDNSWIKVSNPTIKFNKGVGWSNDLEKSTNFVDSATFRIKDKLTLAAGYKVLASSVINGIEKPVIVRINVGKGSLVLDLSEFGLDSSAKQSKLLPSYSQLLNMELSKQQLFSVGNEHLSFITNRLDSLTYTVGVFNNSISEKNFKIDSKIGNIQNISEMDLTVGRKHIISSEGYWPELFQTNNGGANTSTTIMGGDVRFFKIRLTKTPLANSVSPASLGYGIYPTNKFIYFPSLNQAEQQILRWKTMLSHFEGIMVDWVELLAADKATISKNTSWLSLQNLKVVVDFSRGFDTEFKLLSENKSNETPDKLENVFAKMQLAFGKNASNAIFQIPSGCENADVIKALNFISKQANKHNIKLLVYPSNEASTENCLAVIKSVTSNNSNVKFLLNTAGSQNIEQGINLAGSQLGAVMITPDNISKSYVPVQKLNSDILRIFNFNYDKWEKVYNTFVNVSRKTEPIKLGTEGGLAKPEIQFSGRSNDNYQVNPANSSTFLAFRNMNDLKNDVLAVADTVFRYYGGVMLEAKYLMSRDSLALIADRNWLNEKGLKVMVDLSQELNNFPNLTWFIFLPETGKTANTDRMLESQTYMRRVLDKMQILGAENIIIGAHNGPENANGYSTDQLPGIEKFLTFAKSKSIKVHYQNNEYFKNAGGQTYNSASNVENLVRNFIKNKGFSNLSFASNSINVFAVNSNKIYYPSTAPLGVLIIGGSGSSRCRIPTPISMDTRMDISSVGNYPNVIKVLDGGYEIDKATFAKYAGSDARFLKKTGSKETK